MTWSLDKINKEIRLITGVYPTDIPDDRIYSMIQDYWMVTFPSVVKTESLQSKYSFLTRPGVSLYSFPQTFVSLNPLATSENFTISLSYDASLLDVLNYQWHTENITPIDGTQLLYNIVLKYYAEPTSICVFTSQNDYFYGAPNLTYYQESKTISLTLLEPLSPNDFLRVKYKTTNLAPPEWILVKDRSLTLYPIPNQEYIIRISGIRRPQPLPYQGEIEGIPPEFFDLIIYGTALKVLTLTDRDGYLKLYPIYKRQESIAMAKTHQQLLYTEVNGL